MFLSILMGALIMGAIAIVIIVIGIIMDESPALGLLVGMVLLGIFGGICNYYDNQSVVAETSISVTVGAE
jgi:hypothetical protein